MVYISGKPEKFTEPTLELTSEQRINWMINPTCIYTSQHSFIKVSSRILIGAPLAWILQHAPKYALFRITYNYCEFDYAWSWMSILEDKINPLGSLQMLCFQINLVQPLL